MAENLGPAMQEKVRGGWAVEAVLQTWVQMQRVIKQAGNERMYGSLTLRDAHLDFWHE
jgi:hypothetical protein